MACVAQYSADSSWYRAVILRILEPKKLVVQYVDFGNIETVEHTKVKHISDQFLKLPEQVSSFAI